MSSSAAVMLASVSLLVCATGQAVQNVKELVEKLGADRVEDRESADRELKRIGKAAESELRKAAAGGSPEVTARARMLLARLDVLEKLPDKLKEAMPGVEDRLSSGSHRSWTEALLEAASETPTGFRHPSLGSDELDFLVPRAVEGAVDSEKQKICEISVRRGLRGAIPHLAKLLQNSQPTVRASAVFALGNLKAREHLPLIVRATGDGSPMVADRAFGALRQLGAIDELFSLLKDDKEAVRLQAVVSLGELHAVDALPRISPLLAQPSSAVRIAVIHAIARLEGKHLLPDIRPLVNDADRDVRIATLTALGLLEARDSIEDLTRSLVDPDGMIRFAAAGSLCRLGEKSGIPVLLAAAEQEVLVSCSPLNFLRQAEITGASRRKTVRVKAGDGASAIKTQFKAATQLTLDTTGVGTEHFLLTIHLSERILDRGGVASVEDFLSEIHRLTGHDYIVERDSVRFLRPGQALKFWKDWAKTLEKK